MARHNWEIQLVFGRCLKYNQHPLHCTTTTSDIKGSYPLTEDIQFVVDKQLIACKIKGMWELHDTRNIRFDLSNSTNVGEHVKEYRKILK